MNKRSDNITEAIKGAVAPDVVDSMERGNTTDPVGTSNNPSNAIFTVANFITFCRFVLTIVFLVLFVQHDPGLRPAALCCYAIAAITDFLDGQVARRTQTVSWLGKVMDPIMDRVLLFTGVLGLMATGELPIWVAVYVVLRDVYLAIGGIVLRRWRKRPLDVIYVGKAATALLMIGFVDLLLAVPVVNGLGLVNASWLPGLNHEPVAIGIFFVYAGVICSFIATIIYTVKAWNVRKEALARGAEK